MGIINQGILGGFSGKVGPIVGFRWKSNYYIRARAAKVSNPYTEATGTTWQICHGIQLPESYKTFHTYWLQGIYTG